MSHRPVRVVPALLSLLVLFPFPTTHAQWIDWDEVTATNLDADPAVGSADPEEKDFAVADLDNDGDPDVIIARKTPYGVFGPRTNVLLRNTDGVLVDETDTLAPDFATPDNSRDVVIADLDQDGWLDVVVANAGHAPATGEQPRVFMNQGNGAGVWLGLLEEPDRIPILQTANGQGPISSTIAAGDLTGDGFPELYLGDYQNTLADKLLVNDGTGFFTDMTGVLPPGFAGPSYTIKVDFTDVNGDGDLDIVKVIPIALRVVYNESFVFLTFQDLPSSSVYHFATGDLNSDGAEDVYVVQDGQDVLDLNVSQPGVVPVEWELETLGSSPLTAGIGGNAQIVDLDGDGDNDVVVCDQDEDLAGCFRRLAFLENDGTVPVPGIADPYSAPYTVAHRNGTYDVGIGDFDGDGDPDLLVGHCEGTDLYFQQGGGVPPVDPVFLRGDVDGNGVLVGLVDAVFLLNYQFVAGSPEPPCLDAADTDDDGSVSGLVDGLAIMNFQFVPGSPPPAPPYPACGEDPTPDGVTCLAPPICP